MHPTILHIGSWEISSYGVAASPQGWLTPVGGPMSNVPSGARPSPPLRAHQVPLQDRPHLRVGQSAAHPDQGPDEGWDGGLGVHRVRTHCRQRLRGRAQDDHVGRRPPLPNDPQLLLEGGASDPIEHLLVEERPFPLLVKDSIIWRWSWSWRLDMSGFYGE